MFSIDFSIDVPPKGKEGSSEIFGAEAPDRAGGRSLGEAQVSLGQHGPLG